MAIVQVKREITKKTIESSKPAVRAIAAERKVFLTSLALPTERKPPNPNIYAYTGLLYGREKIGKTVTLASFPETIFFSTEPGTKGIDIFEFNAEEGGVCQWDIFRRAVEILGAAKAGNPFKTVAIDTADRAYDMCMDWVCEKRGIENPGKASDGTSDYGASWREVRKEFTTQILKLTYAGFGVWFSSHVKEETIRPRSGQPYTRIHPSMSKQARTVVEALVDFFFYGEYMRDNTGKSIRVFVCEGDETIWAGARKTPAGRFPRFIPILEENGFQIIQDAFSGRYPGLDPLTLRPSLTTTATAKEFIQKQKLVHAGGISREERTLREKE